MDLRNLKVALVYDYLNQLGGGERVLRVLLELFPQAPLFTLFYDEHFTKRWFQGRRIYTSFLQKFPGVASFHRYFIPLMPLAANSLVLKDFDLVISYTSGYAKGVVTNNGAYHIAYINTPLRYAWENSYTNTYHLSSKVQGFITPFFASLRQWDYRVSHGPHAMFAISKFIGKRIKQWYERDAPIIYPPLDTDFFSPTNTKEDFFLAAGRLLHYKRFDLVVDACTALRIPLKIIGGGPELNRLRRSAGPTIEFLGVVSDNTLRNYYSASRALIFPQVEDFGLTAVEALSCGTPIIAYAHSGGPQEFVRHGMNGILFEEQTVSSLSDAISSFKNYSFSSEQCRASVSHFSIPIFKSLFMNAVGEAYYSHRTYENWI